MIWLCVIWLLSSLPSHKLPSVRIFSADKLMHVAVYLVLALLTNNYVMTLGLKRSSVFLIYVILLLSAGMDEYHQTWIANRSVTFWDFLANAIGLSLGFAIHHLKHDQSRKPKP